jgi:hypothetical protein
VRRLTCAGSPRGIARALPIGAAALALFMLLGSCATLPKERGGSEWYGRLPEGKVYFYLDVSSARTFLAETAKKSGLSGLSGMLPRARQVYGELSFPETAAPQAQAEEADATLASETGTAADSALPADAPPAAASDGTAPKPELKPLIDLVATGAFPRGALNLSVSLRKGWKRIAHGGATYFENADGMQLAVPERGVVYVSTGRMEELLSAPPDPRGPDLPPALYAPDPSLPFRAYALEPMTSLAPLLPFRLGLPVQSGFITLADAGDFFSGDVILTMGNEREARIFGTIVKVTVALAAKQPKGNPAPGEAPTTARAALTDFSGASVETSGPSIVIRKILFEKAALAEAIAGALAKESGRTGAKGGAK